MRILGIIPARGNSQGIPGKNIKLLNNLPLIAYSIRQASESFLLNRVIISTDDPEIAEIAKQHGGDVPFLRPKYLATDTSSSLEVILHALDELEKQGEVFDKVCLLQPTSPYRPYGIIDEAIREYKRQKCRSLISIRKVPTHFNPHWTFFLQNGKLFRSTDGPLISQRQNLPNAYHRDGAIYILDVQFMRNNNKLLSDDLCGFEIESPELINIDHPDDWLIAEKYMK
jgi:CMP-N,N'-diacetyllegionaminic acid synthase